MIFDGKELSELSEADLETLIGMPEGLDLEFKERYEADASGQAELLKDVVALANADGGYLVIGVREDDHNRAQEFVSIPQPDREMMRIRDLCLDRIEKRLVGLQIRLFEVDGKSAIVVRVPNEDPKPRWLRLNNMTVRIPRRYADGTRTMTIDEFRDAVLGDRVLRQLGELDARVRSIQSNLSEAVGTQQQATEAALLRISSPDQLRELVGGQFRQRIGDLPTYRLTCLPVPIPTDAPLRSHFEKIVDLVKEPPTTRKGGWDITPTAAPKPDEWGLVAANDLIDGELRLLWNGYAEFRANTKTDSFAWAYSDIRPPRPFLLDARAIIEPIVCFVRFARNVAEYLSNVEAIEIAAEFWNCVGAKLIKFPPGTHGHRMAMGFLDKPLLLGFIEELEDPIVRIAPLRFPVDDLGDAAAKLLVQEIYRRFGHLDAELPYFGENDKFTISG